MQLPHRRYVHAFNAHPVLYDELEVPRMRQRGIVQLSHEGHRHVGIPDAGRHVLRVALHHLHSRGRPALHSAASA